MVELTNVTKRLGDRPVLRDVSLRLESGKTHVLLGASGSGKSTLLRACAGLLPVDSGEIRVEGALVSPRDQRALARKVGLVFQEGALFPHLSAAANAELGARAAGWPGDRMADRLFDLAALVGLTAEQLSRFPRELSGGQRQRVALMRALFADPPVLLLDEPLGALDPITRSELQEELKRLFSSLKRTVILVTHDLGEAAFFGETITLLHEGRIEQQGSFEDLVRRPANAYVSAFIAAQRPVPAWEKVR